MTGFATPNYTQTPNDFFKLIPLMGECELKVTLAIIRQTLGYHKKRDPISFSQLEEMTGLSRQGTQTGVDAALTRGTVVIDGHGARGVNIYALVIEDDYAEILHSSMQKSSNTKETNKRNKKKTVSSGDDAQSKPNDSKPRKPNPIFDAVALGSFGLTKLEGDDKTLGARIGKIVSWLNKQPDITPERVAQFYAWYERKYENADAPRDPGKFAEWWTKFTSNNTPINGDDGEPVTAAYTIGSDDDPFKDEIID